MHVRTLFGVTLPALLLSPVLLCAAGVRICFEAEAARMVEPPMVLVAATNVPAGVTFKAGAAAGAYLEIPAGRGNPPEVQAGQALFELDLPATGTYTLWCRVYWDDECGNSFTVQVDGRAPFVFGENNTFKTWHWVRYPAARTAAPLELEAGRRTIIFRSREDGVRLDQVLLSADRRFVPVDIEPPGVRP